MRESKTLEKQIQKEKAQATRELTRWSHTEFDCEVDAREALSRWEKTLKYHALDEDCNHEQESQARQSKTTSRNS